MADFVGTIMGTAFHVKDDAAFAADQLVQRFVKHAERESGFFEQNSDGTWAFGWYDLYPSVILQSEEEDDQEFDLCDAIQQHIVDGEVCRIGVSGNEKLRYNGGVVLYVSRKGVVCADETGCWDIRLTIADVVGRMKKLAAEVEAEL